MYIYIYKLSYELPNDLGNLNKLGNIRRISKIRRITA